VGFNNFDIEAMTAAGVLASNTPDVLNESVADYAWALMLAAARRVGAGERWLRAGHWPGNATRFDDWLGVDVHGKTLGILGMGRIGQAIARRAYGFDMRVLYHNRSRLPEQIEREYRATWVEKAQLLRESDHLVLVLPFTPANRHAIGAPELAKMKPSAVLVNVARGGIVDDAALAVALREKRLAAAGLDVFEGEPAVHPALLDLDNVVLSPHIASASEDTRHAMAQLAADNVLAALGLGESAGHPPTALNPEVMSAWSDS
jgi:gluconate 2-dehydrogenase